MFLCKRYSYLSNSRGGGNKQGGGAKVPESIKKEEGFFGKRRGSTNS